jgi:hypothetical protein
MISDAVRRAQVGIIKIHSTEIRDDLPASLIDYVVRLSFRRRRRACYFGMPAFRRFGLIDLCRVAHAAMRKGQVPE